MYFMFDVYIYCQNISADYKHDKQRKAFEPFFENVSYALKGLAHIFNHVCKVRYNYPVAKDRTDCRNLQLPAPQPSNDVDE